MINQALDLLKNGEIKSFKLPKDTVLVVTKNAIVYRFFKNRNIEQAILAAKIGESIVGNSSGLTSYARHLGTRDAATKEQLELSELVAMIPFEVLKQAGLDLKTFKELDKGPQETLLKQVELSRVSRHALDKTKANPLIVDFKSEKTDEDYNRNDLFKASYKLKQHFAGARLFSIGDKLFLLDMDRGELEHGILNPFLVELPTKVSTIQDAYKSLKPKEVLDAETSGLKILRQGEWFFIPVTDEVLSARCKKTAKDAITESTKENGKDFASNWANRGILRAGNNRPNHVETLVTLENIFYVSGKVSHSGREHKDLDLKSFYRAIPNTATTSWTITGDVD